MEIQHISHLFKDIHQKHPTLSDAELRAKERQLHDTLITIEIALAIQKGQKLRLAVSTMEASHAMLKEELARTRNFITINMFTSYGKS